jgi:hypothetical protein
MSKWNDQHIKQGKVVAYRPKLSDKTKFGVVKSVEFNSVTVEFSEGIQVVIKDDLTPLWSNFYP